MQLPFTLENASQQGEILSLPDGKITLITDFIAAATARQYYQALLEQTPWQQDSLNFGGRKVPIPRLQAWYGDKKSRYGYSGVALEPMPWTPLLLEMRGAIEEFADTHFNSVLLNFYRDGNDSVAWHSDDESELGHDPLIASLSLGCIRRFELKHRHRKLPKSVCDLPNGSLLVMGKGVQQNWQHAVPKQPGITEGRINLTFRTIHEWTGHE